MLEARDLLFARLLQYRAFQRVAAYAATLQAQGRRFPREVGMEPRFARLMPEVTISISPAARCPGREGDGTEAGQRVVAGPACMHPW